MAGHGLYFDAEEKGRQFEAYAAFGWTPGEHFTGIRVDTLLFLEIKAACRNNQ